MIRIPLSTDIPDTCRCYPRTLEEAFGPNHGQSVVVECEPKAKGTLRHWLRWLCVSAIVVGFACLQSFFFPMP